MPNLIVGANAVLVKESGLEENRLIVICLGSTLAATDGDTLDVTWYSNWSTRYNPLYADARRIRAEYGRFIADIPDDTINQLAWKWSNRAAILRSRGLDTEDFYGAGSLDGDLNAMICADYVTCAVGLDLLTGSPDNAGFQKSLADLRVSRSSGALQEAIDRAYACKSRLEIALKEGGFLGQRAMGTVKGLLSTDRPRAGRLWSSQNAAPAANSRVFERGVRRPRKSFSRAVGRGRYRGF